MAEIKKCETCGYSKVEVRRFCYFNPPRVVVVGAARSISSRRPMVEDDEFCSHWIPEGWRALR